MLGSLVASLRPLGGKAKKYASGIIRVGRRFGKDVVSFPKKVASAAISRALRFLGWGGHVFGNDGVSRLNLYRQNKCKDVSTCQKKDLLLSFPRSGNHWVRFILEFFTGMPTKGCGRRDVEIYRNLFKSLISPLWHVENKGFYFCYKHHGGMNSQWLWTENWNSVLLLIRDFRECMLSRSEHSKRNNSAMERTIRRYLNNLLLYQQSTIPKLHLHYESLIADPRASISSILAFYGIDNPPLLEYFMRRYEKMQILSRTATNRTWMRPRSGNDNAYHQKRHTEEQGKWEDLFQRIYGEDRYTPIRHLLDRYSPPPPPSSLGEEADRRAARKIALPQ